MGWSKRWKLGVEGGEDLITLKSLARSTLRLSTRAI